MILVFAGAGSSAAVSKKDYPTTVEFYDQLNEDIIYSMRNIAHGQFMQYIESLKNDSTKPMDIEKLLGTISNFNNDLYKCVEQGITNYILQQLYPDFLSFAGDSVTNLAVLEQNIYIEIYRLYGKIPTNPQIRLWVNLMDRLDMISQPIEIFTTNYDLVLDRVVRKAEIDIKTAHQEDDLGRYVVGTEYLDKKKNFRGRFIKLHGSVDWELEDKDIIIGSRNDPGDFTRHALIYPGTKEKPEDEPFKTFYDHLMDVAKHTTTAIFIGFSFRDDYINEILENIPDDSPKIIVNKMKKEDLFQGNFPFFPGDFEYFDAGFSEDVLFFLNDRLPKS